MRLNVHLARLRILAIITFLPLLWPLDTSICLKPVRCIERWYYSSWKVKSLSYTSAAMVKYRWYTVLQRACSIHMWSLQYVRDTSMPPESASNQDHGSLASNSRFQIGHLLGGTDDRLHMELSIAYFLLHMLRFKASEPSWEDQSLLRPSIGRGREG